MKYEMLQQLSLVFFSCALGVETLPLSDQDQGGNIPIPGIGVSHKDTRVPHPNIQAGTSLPLPAPYNLILLTSGLAAP